MENRLIRDTDAALFLACSRATFWKLVANGTVPKAIKIGGMSRWRLSDIAAVIEAAATPSPLHPVRQRVRSTKGI